MAEANSASAPARNKVTDRQRAERHAHPAAPQAALLQHGRRGKPGSAACALSAGTTRPRHQQCAACRRRRVAAQRCADTSCNNWRRPSWRQLVPAQLAQLSSPQVSQHLVHHPARPRALRRQPASHLLQVFPAHRRDAGRLHLHGREGRGWGGGAVWGGGAWRRPAGGPRYHMASWRTHFIRDAPAGPAKAATASSIPQIHTRRRARSIRACSTSISTCRTQAGCPPGQRGPAGLPAALAAAAPALCPPQRPTPAPVEEAVQDSASW